MKIPQKTTAPDRQDYRHWLLWGLTLIGILAAFQFPPIKQNPAYHRFADARTFFHIPNFENVASNLPFLFIGIAGMACIWKGKLPGMFPQLKSAYAVFFAGIVLTGFGSAYYHLHPGNTTLLWDRLPMTIAFMAFFCIIVGEFIGFRVGRNLLLPLLLLGVASVLYWHFSEIRGHGDLRFYALVQFLPFLLIPAIMLLYQPKTDTNLYIILVGVAYFLAKVCEACDEQLFKQLGFISGHTLKHLLAALAPLFLLIGLFKRRIIG